MHRDPLVARARRLDPLIHHCARVPEWRGYVGGPVHGFFRRHGFEYLLHARLIAESHFEAGMVGLLMARSPAQGDFIDDAFLVLAQALPTLHAAIRRCARARESLRLHGVLESLLEGAGGPPRLAMDLGGRVLWMSRRAARCVGARLEEPAGAGATLRDAAARMAAALEGAHGALPPSLSVALTSDAGEALEGHLRLGRDSGGGPFVVVELEGGTLAVADTAERFGLTPTETEILAHVARGLRDRDIAARTCTTENTVRTHVTRVLAKLGVRSRVEAALLARGLRLEANRTS